MKAFELASATALALVIVCAGEAWGQCQSGGGGDGATTASSSSGGTTATTSSAQLLTGPGSWAYDVMMAQQVQMNYARRQAIVSAQKAAKAKERKDKAQSVARQRRQEELYRRAQAKSTALSLAAR